MNLQVENSIFETELKVQQALQKREGGKTEYETLVGFADLVTDEYVIEFKHVSDWKEGLKVLAYQDQLPTRKPLTAYPGQLLPLSPSPPLPLSPSPPH